MADVTGQAILDDLRAEQALYGEMLGMAREQKGAVERGDHSAVAVILGRKQDILGRIDAVETRLGPVKREWASVRATLSEPDRLAIQALVEAIGGMLQELMRLEEEVGQTLARLQGQVGADLRRLVQSKRMMNAYGGPSAPKAPDPRFLDRKE